MKEAAKNLETKPEVRNTLDLGDKNREKMKKNFKRSVQRTCGDRILACKCKSLSGENAKPPGTSDNSFARKCFIILHI